MYEARQNKEKVSRRIEDSANKRKVIQSFIQNCGSNNTNRQTYRNFQVISCNKTLQLVGGYIPNQNGPYVGLGLNMASPNNDFTLFQRNQILTNNSNRGQNMINVSYHDDQTQNPLGAFNQAAAIDHIYPKQLGGVNAYINAQVIDASTNSRIGNAYPKMGYTGSRLYVGHNWTLNGMQLPAGSILPIIGNGAQALISTPWGNINLNIARAVGLLTTQMNPL